jgi:hypothetical protein
MQGFCCFVDTTRRYIIKVRFYSISDANIFVLQFELEY